jgi:hypothetical protein
LSHDHRESEPKNLHVRRRNKRRAFVQSPFRYRTLGPRANETGATLTAIEKHA